MGVGRVAADVRKRMGPVDSAPSRRGPPVWDIPYETGLAKLNCESFFILLLGIQFAGRVRFLSEFFALSWGPRAGVTIHAGKSSWNHERHEKHERKGACGIGSCHRAGEVIVRRPTALRPFVFVSFVSFVVRRNCRFQVHRFAGSAASPVLAPFGSPPSPSKTTRKPVYGSR